MWVTQTNDILGNYADSFPCHEGKLLEVHNAITQWVGEAIPPLLRLDLLSVETNFESPSSNPRHQRRYLSGNHVTVISHPLALCSLQSIL